MRRYKDKPLGGTEKRIYLYPVLITATVFRMKIRLYKAASIAMIILGSLHTLYFIGSIMRKEPVIYDTLSHVIKKGIVGILGERSLLSYYNGYSLSMGLLLISYGLLALFTRPDRRAMILSTFISFTAFVISVFYFHPLAYVLTGVSFACYLMSLVWKRGEAVQTLSSK